MMADAESAYQHIRSGGAGFYEQKRGRIAVWGKEAVPFLDGMITNDVKTLASGQKMLAAFPNAQGRLLAVVSVLRDDDRFVFETEEATRDKVYQNLFRFTFAGDFFVEDQTDQWRYFDLMNLNEPDPMPAGFSFAPVGAVQADEFRDKLLADGAVEIPGEAYEILRIETGVPRFGVDMDETTIVPELGIDGLISYNKGCYVGQEIIARIHFRGHVAKQLAGLILSVPPDVANGLASRVELTSVDGKNAGRITSVTFSPKLKQNIALAYVRYEHLAPDTVLIAGGVNCKVTTLPFVGSGDES